MLMWKLHYCISNKLNYVHISGTAVLITYLSVKYEFNFSIFTIIKLIFTTLYTQFHIINWELKNKNIMINEKKEFENRVWNITKRYNIIKKDKRKKMNNYI